MVNKMKNFYNIILVVASLTWILVFSKVDLKKVDGLLTFLEITGWLTSFVFCIRLSVFVVIKQKYLVENGNNKNKRISLPVFMFCGALISVANVILLVLWLYQVYPLFIVNVILDCFWGINDIFASIYIILIPHIITRFYLGIPIIPYRKNESSFHFLSAAVPICCVFITSYYAKEINLKAVNFYITCAEIFFWFIAFISNLIFFLIVDNIYEFNEYLDDLLLKYYSLFGCLICAINVTLLLVWLNEVFPTMNVNVALDCVWSINDVMMSLYFLIFCHVMFQLFKGCTIVKNKCLYELQDKEFK